MKKCFICIGAIIAIAMATRWHFVPQDTYDCESIKPIPEYLEYLTPQLRMVECTYWNESRNPNKGILSQGCKAPYYSRYIVEEDAATLLIKNKDEFVTFFSPVETPGEALAFVVALTDAYPLYDIIVPTHWRTFTSYIEKSHIEETNDGFLLNLFEYDVCGCGPHSYYAVNYLVTSAGEIKEMSRKKVYENPEEDGLCMD